MKNVSNITQEKIEGSIKVNIPKNVVQKIQYLCNVISSLEWSGILFYTVRGTIKNPSKMVITLKDILPMDKGTATSTEFSYDKRYVDFLMGGGEERLEYKSGLIHSHNNMSVFYSGTDQDELMTNSKSHNFYLSVVVNNKLDIIGRVGISGIVETTVNTYYKGLDEKGNPYTLSPTKLKVKHEKLYYIDCDMIYDKVKPFMDEEFTNNVKTIMNPVKSYTPPKSTINYREDKKYPSLKSDWGYMDYQQKVYDDMPPVTTKIKSSFNSGLRVTKMDEFLYSECENFLIRCFGFDDEESSENMELIDIIDNADALIKTEELTIPEVIEDFSSNFISIFEQHFFNMVYNTEAITQTIQDILDEYIDEFPFIKEIKNFISKL